MTRAQAIQSVAKQLAVFDKYDWQRCPTAAQAKKQSRYALNAFRLIIAIEGHMVNFAWTPEKDTAKADYETSLAEGE